MKNSRFNLEALYEGVTNILERRNAAKIAEIKSATLKEIEFDSKYLLLLNLADTHKELNEELLKTAADYKAERLKAATAGITSYIGYVEGKLIKARIELLRKDILQGLYTLEELSDKVSKD